MTGDNVVPFAALGAPPAQVNFSVFVSQSREGLSFSLRGVRDERESREAAAEALEVVARKLREGD